MMHELTTDSLFEQFSSLYDWQSQYRHLIRLGDTLPLFPAEAKNDKNLIRGCEAPIWLLHSSQGDIHHFLFDSEAKIIRGLLMILLISIQNQSSSFIVQFDFTDYLRKLGLARHLSTSRANGLNKIFIAVRERVLN